ncbi:NAA40 acetyltransferase, partial [Sclerurus mexicanus]|nr:NAA40 acetyltransferase [Sclerurus mexicanus]
RKSSKAKEKKQRRQEERAAMAAVCARVEAANKLQDPLEAFPVFKKYDRNGLNVSIECRRVSGLEPSTLDWAFELTKANMQTLYEQSEWGWKEREKREELRDERAWYLLARDPDTAPVAFSHFRFDVEAGDEVLYCYEVQLESRVRRRGLGKVTLCPQVWGQGALGGVRVTLCPQVWGQGALGGVRVTVSPPSPPRFEVDPTSPSVSGCCGDDSSYEILSRSTRFGDPHPGGPCGGCCH